MQVPVPSYYFYSFFRLAQQIEEKRLAEDQRCRQQYPVLRAGKEPDDRQTSKNGQRKKRWPYFFIHSHFMMLGSKSILTLVSFYSAISG